MNGYNFTDRVRRVLQLAREEAHRLRHKYVDTEHILLGMIREGEGIAAAVLTNLNADSQDLRQAIETTVKRGRAVPAGPDLLYTSRAKTALECAMREARELNHSYIGTEHLLLGLLAEKTRDCCAGAQRRWCAARARARGDAPLVGQRHATWSRTAPIGFGHAGRSSTCARGGASTRGDLRDT